MARAARSSSRIRSRRPTSGRLREGPRPAGARAGEAPPRASTGATPPRPAGGRSNVLVAEARPDERRRCPRARRGRHPDRRIRRSAGRARRSCRRLCARRTATVASVPTATGSSPGTRSRERAGTRPRVEQGEAACDGQQERRVGEDGEPVSAPGGDEHSASPVLRPRRAEKAAGREEAGRERVVAQAVDAERHEHDRRGGGEAARSDVGEQTPKRDEGHCGDAHREEEVEMAARRERSRPRPRASARARRTGKAAPRASAGRCSSRRRAAAHRGRIAMGPRCRTPRR